MGESYLRRLQIGGAIPEGVSAIYTDDRRIGAVALLLFYLVLFE